MIVRLEEKAIDSALLNLIQVSARFLEKRLSDPVRIVNHALLSVYLPALVLKLSSIWIEEKPILLIAILC